MNNQTFKIWMERPIGTRVFRSEKWFTPAMDGTVKVEHVQVTYDGPQVFLTETRTTLAALDLLAQLLNSKPFPLATPWTCVKKPVVNPMPVGNPCV